MSHSQTYSRPQLRSRLHEQLTAGNFHLFASVCQDVLKAIGCQEVRLAGRLRFKGKNQGGGYDLEATLPGPLPRPVVVQLKQFRSQRVFQRSIDELRGAALRAGAAEAILITSGPLSRVLQDTRAKLTKSPVPVRLIDGQELLDLLLAHEIGVMQIEETLVFDDAYFARLAKACVDQGLQESYRKVRDKSPTLTIRFERRGRVRYQFLP
ncbi:restriction endonuclease [Armatimonas rosea]|uniref:Restriction endonuclease Mrr n=1 Tax=Armatimonas rosea TaxID=685828 RepID=A0A7W9W6M3_ARMRO|nr:restriction endonuclease [Armatimonas rosea]MBB6050733.1 restriction endonuclease Mrr [Armatimonas rosea]